MSDPVSIERMDDVALMQRVFELAERGRFTTFPNPRVGCVLVKEGKIVGEGFHLKAGGLHAEREALKQAGEAARGATCYVNLEPCCHQGRTPPCIDGLIDAGVSKVIAAMPDPNPLVAGGGFDFLKQAGIDIESGLLQEQAIWLNRGFVKRMNQNRPWVVLKSAATLDGRTAAFDGESKWITGSEARQQVQHLRASCSAVITGIDTVLADDPQMTVRLPDAEHQPYRVVLDSQLRLPLEAQIIGIDQQLVVFTLSDDLTRIAALTEAGAEVIQQRDKGAGRLDLDLVLDELGKWQCNEVLVEAGQTLSGAFLGAGLVDQLELFYAGSLLGDQGKSMFQFDQALPFANRVAFQVNNTEMVGEDIRVQAVNSDSLAQLQNQKVGS
ncbi:MAG: bifunctional diaminohydroxyphosphoribosylaminopyrimidine deaminase/5-amino-6-(5-phosphoribosylamino)uracil reductase RibD [Pseudomonadota bacterium]